MNLEQKYNRDNFLAFLKSFVPEYEKDIRRVGTNVLQVTKEAMYLGKSAELDLEIFELTHSSSTDARIALAMDGFKVMKHSATYRALVIYRADKGDDWRLSLMTATPGVNQKGKVIQSLSNPRRFSFFLGPNAKVNTPYQFLIKQGAVKDFAELQKRFSLEVVNKEFYKEISENFTKLVGGTLGSGKNQKTYEAILKLPSVAAHSQVSLDFAVRLIGRIIFCWFLREKRSPTGKALMPKDLLSLDAIGKNSDYYHQVLEPIFFEVLNKGLNSRVGPYANEPFSHIPYLNGGLFSPHEDDYYKRRSGEQSMYHNTLVIPDQWFVDFFGTLETYNFTIDENTSFDEELSIDPEMLGRIFENLLAEINPETGESARKSTGSYYTPRVIVDYMVDESLLFYLKQQTNIEEDKLRALISYDLNDDLEYPLDEDEKQEVIDALEKLKLLDPACGSGAFPIGALQKIVFILQQVDPDGQLWFRKQIKSTSPEIRHVIEREFSHKNFNYIRKLGIIRENIYGIDIQPVATEISRLRCFLTLVVDERVDDSLENRGIEPLPNLDFKFVTANSLIGLPSNQQTNLFKDQTGIDQLKDLRDQFFNATNSERYQLKDAFKKIQKRMLLRMIEMSGGDELTQKLSAWDPFSHNPTNWFDSEWMFGVVDGFDVVIANPPYIDSETMVREQPDLRQKYSEIYSTTKGNWDLYIPFLELGYNLLTSSGVASFITPNKWYGIGYGKEIIKKLIYNIQRIANCNLVKVFQAGNSPVVTIFGKNNPVEQIVVDKFDEDYSIIQSLSIEVILLASNLGLALANSLSTVLSIRGQANTIADYYDAENPCSVAEAYKIQEIIEELSERDQVDQSYFRFVNTGTIDPFLNLWGKKNTTYLKVKYHRPVIKKAKFKDLFPRRYEQTVKPKLIISGMRHFESFVDEEGRYIAGKSTEILLQKTNLSLKVALAIFNSKLIRFYIKQAYNVLGIDGGINFTTDLIEGLPIPKLEQTNEQKTLVEVIDKILAITKDEDYPNNSGKQAKMKELERQIDQMVYQLYGLTSEEIAVVESSAKS